LKSLTTKVTRYTDSCFLISVDRWIIREGHCFLISGSLLVHFRIQPGTLSVTETPCNASAVGADESGRVVVATADGEIQARQISSMSEAELLFKHDKVVTSLACVSHHIFLASMREHSVHIYAAGGDGWVHTFIVGDGRTGTIDSLPPRFAGPELFCGPSPGEVFLKSGLVSEDGNAFCEGSNLYTISLSGKLSRQAEFRGQDFLTGEMPILGPILGVYQQRIFRIAGEMQPLRYLSFGS